VLSREQIAFIAYNICLLIMGSVNIFKVSFREKKWDFALSRYQYFRKLSIAIQTAETLEFLNSFEHFSGRLNGAPMYVNGHRSSHVRNLLSETH